MAHIKGIVKPKSFQHVNRRWRFTVSPSPGPHPKNMCMPLQIVVRDVLHLAESGSEAKKIIKKGDIQVDGRPVKDHKYPVGLFDVISIPALKKHYRVVPSKKVLSVVEVDKSESGKKLCRIENKTIVKGGKVQLNLHDGKNILVGKDEYSTYDTLVLAVPSLKVEGHIKKEKSVAVLIGGKNIGTLGKWTDERVARSSMSNLVVLKTDDKELEIKKDSVFPVGQDKPAMTVNV